MSSKEEAKSDAYKRLWEEARATVDELRASTERQIKTVDGLEARVEVLESSARIRETLRAVEVAKAVEGAKADLLAATRRAVVTEAALEEAGLRSRVLEGALLMIAAWPTAHSSEARAMKDAARQALKDADRVRRFPPAEEQR